MVSGKWNMAKILPGGSGKRVRGKTRISQLHPRGGILDSAAVFSWGLYMYQPGAFPDPVLLSEADWRCSGL